MLSNNYLTSKPASDRPRNVKDRGHRIILCSFIRWERFWGREVAIKHLARGKVVELKLLHAVQSVKGERLIYICDGKTK